MNHTEKTLVHLLASERALWHPLRSEDWTTATAPTVIYEHRREFRDKGVRWTAGGADAERKTSERFLSGLVEQGLIEAFGQPRRSHCRLTHRGRWLATALARMPDDSDGWSSVLSVLEYAGGVTGVWVSELLVAGLEGYRAKGARRQLARVADFAVPAIVAGWIEATSDVHGRVYYAVTLDGLMAAQQPEPTPPDDLPGPDDEAKRLYDEAEAAARDQLRTEKPHNPSEIGFVPFSCSPGSMAVTPWNYKPQTTTT
jgi:hypothetical protein